MINTKEVAITVGIIGSGQITLGAGRYLESIIRHVPQTSLTNAELIGIGISTTVLALGIAGVSKLLRDN